MDLLCGNSQQWTVLETSKNYSLPTLPTFPQPPSLSDELVFRYQTQALISTGMNFFLNISRLLAILIIMILTALFNTYLPYISLML
jgi:hypothetical protein